jgi:hypothetical protein
MKFVSFFFIPFLLFFSGCHDRKEDENNVSEHPRDFKSLESHFKNPPNEYSTAPLWVWNDYVTREKIDQQLNDFKNNGIHQVFIHPRPGLITQYLSKEWFELVAYAVQKGKNLKMKIWLYDENSFPSGFAGGHVPASLPPDADRVVGLKMQKLKMLEPSEVESYTIILKKIGNSFANISNGVQNYLNEPGEYYAFTKWYYPDHQGLFGGFSYVDLLAYGITERFVRLTMKGYKEYIGGEFGKTVPGIFTDEPHIHTTDDPSVIRFTPVLFSRFSEVYGYQLENYLPCLFEEIGDWKNIRHDYYSLLLNMFIDRWAKPWKTYTDTNDLKWTGHYWEHMWPNPTYVADNMALYAWHQIPGIDMLFNNEKGRPDQFGNIRAVKELGSVANQLGKKRTLSETYGGSGWDLNFSDMKRLGDWEFALGVNMMCQHLSYMTIKGARKRDFPQSFSYHAPWWNQYKILTEYFHRLSFVLSSGQQINKILIIEPTSTAWMYFSPDQGIDAIGTSGKMIVFENSFREFLKYLEKHQVEYDLGSERILSESGLVEETLLKVGRRNYSLVILPPCFENLEEHTFNLLINYLDHGGKLITFNGMPSMIDGNISRKAKETFSKYQENIMVADSISEQLIQEYLMPDEFVPEDPGNWKGDIFHHRRQMKDGQLLFFSNFDTLQTSSIQFKCKGKSVVELDLLTGKIFFHPFRQIDEFCFVNFKLPPANSKLLFVSEKNEKFPEIKISDVEKSKPLPSGKTRIRINGLNALTLDYCDLEVNDKTYKDIYFYQAADSVFKDYLGEIYGFNYNPWSVAVQYRTNILDKNENLELTKGYAAHFEFYIAEGFLPDQIQAVIENPGLNSVSINDHPISPIPEKWWLDREFGVYDLSDLIGPGHNRLTIQVAPMNVLAELEPVYLIGNYSVYPEEKGWRIHPPEDPKLGSWKEQGLPFFSESVSYIKNISVEDQVPESVKVVVPSWNGAVAEIIVNHEHVGAIAWPPDALDISTWLKQGENEIEVKIFGSLKNLLGPHHNHPTRGFVTPWSFFYAPAHQPPGSEYDLNDYGLLQDFQLTGY